MLAADDHWHTRAKAALRDDLAAILRNLHCGRAAGEGGRATGRRATPRAEERSRQILADLHAAEAPDLAMLSVAVRELSATWRARCQLRVEFSR